MAGQSVRAAVQILREELSRANIHPDKRLMLCGVRLRLIMALDHCREAWEECREYTLPRDMPPAPEKKKGGKKGGQATDPVQ